MKTAAIGSSWFCVGRNCIGSSWLGIGMGPPNCIPFCRVSLIVLSAEECDCSRHRAPMLHVVPCCGATHQGFGSYRFGIQVCILQSESSFSRVAFFSF